jgi:hypothetical protein
MNKNEVILRTEFKDSLEEGTFEVEIINHHSNVVLGPCVEVKIEHSQDEDLNFYETFDPEGFPQNFYDALPRDWDYVADEIRKSLV